MERVLRGRLLRFLSEPAGLGDAASYTYCEDGAILIRDGTVVTCGPTDGVMQAAGGGVEVVDHRPHLMMPGFIDTHIHMPQAQVIASWGAQLLDWLNTYTFPEETRFSDPAHAARIAGAFLDLLARARHDHGGRLLLFAPDLGRCLLHCRRGPRPQDDRRQGDDGPQLPHGRPRHRPGLL